MWAVGGSVATTNFAHPGDMSVSYVDEPFQMSRSIERPRSEESSRTLLGAIIPGTRNPGTRWDAGRVLRVQQGRHKFTTDDPANSYV